METNAAIYLRVSTDEQATSGYGLAAQLAKCEAMATVKGWPVAYVFQDDGVSGTRDESARPGLAALLEAVEQGQVGAVIVASLDRIGRSTRLVLRLVDELAERRAAVVSCKESLDTTSPAGQFVLTMFAALAQLERDTIVERTTSGRNERGRIDGERGGRVPMGYERVMAGGKATGDILINGEGAAVVTDIYKRRAAGATLVSIADELNRRGIRTRRGGRWYASSVREILLNEPAYHGGLRGDSDRAWPSILSGRPAGLARPVDKKNARRVGQAGR